MRRSRAGFTLVEALTALVVLGVLAGLAAPSLSAFLAQLRTRGALNELATDVAYARALAVKNGRRAVLLFVPSPECEATSPRFRAGYEYRVVVRTARRVVAREVSLRDRAPGVCVEMNGSDSIAFNSRGLLLPVGNRRVRAVFRGARDSLTVSALGRVYRRW
jgi:prepilin-type N-terminal cleavage/methylation domain-containing protein